MESFTQHQTDQVCYSIHFCVKQCPKILGPSALWFVGLYIPINFTSANLF